MELKITNRKGQVFMVLYDECDHEIISKYKWCLLVGKKGNVYATAIINGRATLMHRYILGVMDRNIKIDHKNGDGLCNLRSNIRPCTSSQNMMNRDVQVNSKSGFKGVTMRLHKGSITWNASVTVAGKVFNLGNYGNIIDAAFAYNEGAKKHHGPFARLNDVGKHDGQPETSRKIRRNNGDIGYIGVWLNGKRYCASLSRDKVRYHIGSFKTAIDAALAYDGMAKEIWGSKARLNFPLV